MASIASQVLEELAPDELDTLDGSPTEGKIPDKKTRKSTADMLLEYANESGVIVFKDEYGAGFAAIAIDGRQEIHGLNSKMFRLWLQRLWYQKTEKALQSDALRMVQQTLQSQAAFGGDIKPLSLRAACGIDGAFYYDLGDPSWAVVRIDDDGYEVKPAGPILFRRRANTGAQVRPSSKGLGLWAFLDHVNIKHPSDQRLLLVYLCLCCVPDIPRLVLVAHGEKGAGKSFLLRLVRRIVDPAALEIQSLPHDKNEMALTLASSSFVGFDNVDHLQAWQSDAICCASTGGGVKKRELYSDDDEVILKFKHSVALCGVSNVVSRPDLMDRALLIELARIDPADRKTESEIEADFEKSRASILGDVFKTISAARKILPTIRARNLPRMADSARWGAAIAEALGIGAEQFFEDIAANGASANDESIRANPVALAISLFVADRPSWEGSPALLLVELRNIAGQEAIDTASRSWPSSADALGKKIRFVKSNLADAGILLESYRDSTTARRRMWRITNVALKIEKQVSEVSKVDKPSIFAEFGEQPF